MILGLNAAAYFVVANNHSFAWLVLLLAAAFALLISPSTSPLGTRSGTSSHGDATTNIWHTIVYEIQNVNGVLFIPLIAWLTPWSPIWPTEWPLLAQLLLGDRARRLRLHVRPLPEPSLSASVAAACRPPWRLTPLRLQRSRAPSAASGARPRHGDRSARPRRHAGQRGRAARLRRLGPAHRPALERRLRARAPSAITSRSGASITCTTSTGARRATAISACS